MNHENPTTPSPSAVPAGAGSTPTPERLDPEETNVWLGSQVEWARLHFWKIVEHCKNAEWWRIQVEAHKGFSKMGAIRPLRFDGYVDTKAQLTASLANEARLRAVLAEIKDKINASDDFSADEVNALIESVIGKLSIGPTWSLNAGLKEENFDLKTENARLREELKEANKAFDDFGQFTRKNSGLNTLPERCRAAAKAISDYNDTEVSLMKQLAGSAKGAEQQDKEVGNDVRQSSDPIASEPVVSAHDAEGRAFRAFMERGTFHSSPYHMMRDAWDAALEYAKIAEGSPQLSDAVPQPPQPPPSAQLAERVRNGLGAAIHKTLCDHEHSGGRVIPKCYGLEAKLLSAILPLIQDNQR